MCACVCVCVRVLQMSRTAIKCQVHCSHTLPIVRIGAVKNNGDNTGNLGLL